MRYVVHVTINYPEGEEIEYTHKHDDIWEVSAMIEGYIREDTPSSWVFIVTREESYDN